ncbi:hypothetical protein chiPu_0016338 [Chiloscyllium punctatum]|uniref:Uncharacterized protein n=1 Tax=Chiloscyllium punctatum TaxID=137246 RepID=A0A401T594_CHIPU|nr:hypothetical protein [Chiloscyllium punctatum]
MPCGPMATLSPITKACGLIPLCSPIIGLCPNPQSVALTMVMRLDPHAFPLVKACCTIPILFPKQQSAQKSRLCSLRSSLWSDPHSVLFTTAYGTIPTLFPSQRPDPHCLRLRMACCPFSTLFPSLRPAFRSQICYTHNILPSDFHSVYLAMSCSRMPTLLT